MRYMKSAWRPFFDWPSYSSAPSVWPSFSYPSPMSEETQNARVELDDALSTWTHRLSRYQSKQTTQNSVFSALTDIINPAVSVEVIPLVFADFASLSRLSFFASYPKTLLALKTTVASAWSTVLANHSRYGKTNMTEPTGCPRSTRNSKNSATNTLASKVRTKAPAEVLQPKVEARTVVPATVPAAVLVLLALLPLPTVLLRARRYAAYSHRFVLLTRSYQF